MLRSDLTSLSLWRCFACWQSRPSSTFFGLSGVLTNIGFAPSPFPVNILPGFFFFWLIVGVLALFFYIRCSPERYAKIGHLIRIDE